MDNLREIPAAELESLEAMRSSYITKLESLYGGKGPEQLAELSSRQPRI